MNRSENDEREWMAEQARAKDPRSGNDRRAPVLGYESLQSVLDRAYGHAAVGKGKERHASGEPFEQQPIVVLGMWMGASTEGNIFQACKKALESTRLPLDKAVSELLGAINYLAGAVIILESAKRDEVKHACGFPYPDETRCSLPAPCKAHGPGGDPKVAAAKEGFASGDSWPEIAHRMTRAERDLGRAIPPLDRPEPLRLDELRAMAQGLIDDVNNKGKPGSLMSDSGLVGVGVALAMTVLRDVPGSVPVLQRDPQEKTDKIKLPDPLAKAIVRDVESEKTKEQLEVLRNYTADLHPATRGEGKNS